MKVRSKKQREMSEPNSQCVWSLFTQRFESLATALVNPDPLTVSEEFSGEGNKLYRWVFSPPFHVLDRFEEVAIQAGTCLGASADADPLSFWIDYVTLYLWRHNPASLRIRNFVSNEGRYKQRVVDDVIEASKKFSTWLARSPTNVIDAVTPAVSSESLPWKHNPLDRQTLEETSSRDKGEVWAARKNREREERTRIVEALRDLGVRQDEWPTMVRDWRATALTLPNYSYQQLPSHFQPPAYDRLGVQSLNEWRTAADNAWAAHRAEFIATCRYWESKLFDERIPPAPRTRGAGKSGRNTDVKDRYTWAALRLMGTPWKEIAAGTSTIKKAASRILHLANWPTSKRIKSSGGEHGRSSKSTSTETRQQQMRSDSAKRRKGT